MKKRNCDCGNDTFVISESITYKCKPVDGDVYGYADDVVLDCFKILDNGWDAQLMCAKCQKWYDVEEIIDGSHAIEVTA